MNPAIHKDLHLIYTTSIGDIRFAKQQQWRLTYYALLLIIGVFYLRSSDELHLFWHIFLALITLVIAISAVLLIIEIEKDLYGYRSKMIKIENALSGEFKKINPADKDKLKYKQFEIRKWILTIPCYKYEYLLIQTVAILATAVILIILAFL